MRFRERLALLVVGGTVLLVSVVGTATASRNIERTLRRQFGRVFTAPAELGHVEFSFLDGLAVEGFKLYDPSDPVGPPLLEVERLEVEYELDVTGTGPRVTRVRLERPHVRIRLDDEGRMELLDALRRPEEVATEDDASPPLPEILLREGTLWFHDERVLAEPTVLSRVEALVRVDDEGQVQARVLGRSDLLGPIAARATLGDEANVELDLSELRIAPSLADRFQDEIADVIRRTQPHGAAALSMRAGFADGRIDDPAATLTLSAASLRVPLPAEADGAPPEPIPLTGVAAEFELDGGVMTVRSLTADLLGGRAALSGSIGGLLESPARPTVSIGGAITGLTVDDTTNRHLPPSIARVLDAFQFRGALDLDELAVELDDDGADVAVIARPRGASMRYDGYVQPDTGRRVGFAYDATDIQGEIRVDGVVIELDLAAYHDDVRVEAVGTIDYLEEGVERLDLTISAEDVPLDEDLRAAFQDRADRLFDRWAPTGVAAGVAVHLVSVPAIDQGSTVTEVHLRLDDRATFQPEDFPARFRTGVGTVDVTYPLVEGERVEQVIVKVPVQGDGFQLDAEVRSVGDRFELDATGRADAVERSLVPAVLASPKLSEAVKDVLRTTRPTGSTRLEASIVPDADRVVLDLEALSVEALPNLPLALDDLSGHLTIDAEAVQFDDVRGSTLGATVEGSGRITDEVVLDVQARGLPLGERLRERLGRYREPAEPFYDALAPTESARADVHLVVDEVGEIGLGLERLSGGIAPAGVALTATNGELAYRGTEVRAWLDAALPHGPDDEGRSREDGSIEVRNLLVDTETGDVQLDLAARRMDFPRDLTGLLDETTVAAIEEQMPHRWTHVRGLPESDAPDHLALVWEAAERRLRLDGTVDLRPTRGVEGREEGLAPTGALEFRDVEFTFTEFGTVGIDGRLTTAGFDLNPGLAVSDLRADAILGGQIDEAGWRLWLDAVDASLRILDQDLTETSVLLEYELDRLKIRDLSARLDGGTLTGAVRRTPRMAYAGRLGLSDASLREAIGGEDDDEFTGRVDGEVRFRNRTGDPVDLTGSGRIDVRDARLGVFPPVFRLTRVLGMAVPLAEAAPDDSASMEFRLEGPWLRIRRLQLDSEELELRDGEGRVSLDDGRLDLTVYPLVNVSVLPIGIVERLLKELQRLPQALDVHTAHVGGTLRNPTVSYRVLPRADTEQEDLLPQPIDPSDVKEDPPW